MESIALNNYFEARQKITNETTQNAFAEHLSKVSAGDTVEPQALFNDREFQTAEDLLEMDESTRQAVITIRGIMTSDGPDFFDMLFGIAVTGYRQIQEAIAMVASNELIDTLLLKMDTPGGTVAGMDETFLQLSELGTTKTIIVHNEGMLASAGYWIAMSASKIIATSPPVLTGSIGVVAIGLDISGALAQRGIKEIEVVSEHAPDKRAGIDTEDGRKIILERINALERIFLTRVSAGRNVSVDTVINEFGKGSVLVAEDPDVEKPSALSTGMIDEVLGSLTGNNKTSKITDINSSTKEKEGTMTLTNLTELMSSDAGIKAQVDVLLKQQFDAGFAKAESAIEARVKKATPHLTSPHGKAIHELAAKVIAGESEPSALESAVATLDTIAEAKASEAAANETDKTKETNASDPDLNNGDDNGDKETTIKTEEDLNKQIADSKSNLGKVDDNESTE